MTIAFWWRSAGEGCHYLPGEVSPAVLRMRVLSLEVYSWTHLGTFRLALMSRSKPEYGLRERFPSECIIEVGFRRMSGTQKTWLQLQLLLILVLKVAFNSSLHLSYRSSS